MAQTVRCPPFSPLFFEKEKEKQCLHASWFLCAGCAHTPLSISAQFVIGLSRWLQFVRIATRGTCRQCRLRLLSSEAGQLRPHLNCTRRSPCCCLLHFCVTLSKGLPMVSTSCDGKPLQRRVRVLAISGNCRYCPSLNQLLSSIVHVTSASRLHHQFHGCIFLYSKKMRRYVLETKLTCRTNCVAGRFLFFSSCCCTSSRSVCCQRAYNVRSYC